ncbi:VOC family protein [Nostocaceae cyanobacterium CENA369]|uniref:VOC family protein n=1 Tax=Dendronalium phyllosphericum CENA369 TaxID=1725256 RepID=A0A8J7I1N4_9NOST|nr:VOC family protein [Dendronalium phyllosphericum]MBH8572373.1 VOC family protein [Dendronalium phyllosphericum CENA369]
MNNKNNIKSNFGNYLQGVQHVGITVHNMAKSLEFYTEVLGGKLVVSGDAYSGKILHHTLFQKEEIEALNLEQNSPLIEIPDIRDGNKQVLDIRFISFGNIAVELLHFRDAKLTPNARNWINQQTKCHSSEKTCVAYVPIMYLSFHVKDDVDLNKFAKSLEAECRKREIDLVCNRIIHVDSEEARRQTAFKYTANKFWYDPDYFIEGYSDSDFGDFYGWSLFYAKGPNGEQLEFNQVTRKIKDLFIKGQKEYNQDYSTTFNWPSALISSYQ